MKFVYFIKFEEFSIKVVLKLLLILLLVSNRGKVEFSRRESYTTNRVALT